MTNSLDAVEMFENLKVDMSSVTSQSSPWKLVLGLLGGLWLFNSLKENMNSHDDAMRSMLIELQAESQRRLKAIGALAEASKTDLRRVNPKNRRFRRDSSALIGNVMLSHN